MPLLREERNPRAALIQRRSIFSPDLKVRQRRAKPWLHPRFVAEVEIKAVMSWWFRRL